MGTHKPAGVGLRSSHGCIRLYPEDIGAVSCRRARRHQGRVVNQPFVFRLAVTAAVHATFDVLRTTRATGRGSRRLLSKSLAARCKQRCRRTGPTSTGRWCRRSRAAPAACRSDHRPDATVEQIRGRRACSTCCRKAHLGWQVGTAEDEAPKQMLSEIEPGAPAGDAPGRPPMPRPGRRRQGATGSPKMGLRSVCRDGAVVAAG